MRHWTIFLPLLILFMVGCNREEPIADDFLQGDLAFIAAENRVLILNIANETRPEQVASVTLPGEVVKVVADSSFLYIVHNPSVNSWQSNVGPPDAGLQIVDITQPTEPKLLGFFQARNLPTDVVVRGDVAYLADWDQIAVVDMSNKTYLTSPFSITDGANSVFIRGARLFASQGGCSFRTGNCGGALHIYDVTNPKRPYPANTLPADELPGYDVAVANDYAFLAGKGVWVVNIKDEEALMLDGRYVLEQEGLYPAKIVTQGDIAYSLHSDGLHLLDISQPTAPTLLGQYRTDNYLQDLAVRGNTAYLVGWNGLEIVDVADPANPQQIGSYAFANPVPSAPQPTATP